MRQFDALLLEKLIQSFHEAGYSYSPLVTGKEYVNGVIEEKNMDCLREVKNDVIDAPTLISFYKGNKDKLSLGSLNYLIKLISSIGAVHEG